MKKIKFVIFLLLPLELAFAQNLKPYTLGLETAQSVTDIIPDLEVNLEENGIDIIGVYQPADDVNRTVLVFTADELIKAVADVGNRTGFAASLRIGITEENGKTLVTYTNPEYWGRAYFRNDFEKVSDYYKALSNKLESAMQATGTFIATDFGSNKGLSTKKLAKYRYMFNMPRFDNTVILKQFDSYYAAVDKIEASIQGGVENVDFVYKVDFPDKELSLYGFALSGEKGEGRFMPIIDFGNPKHTAFLPYEILVMGDEVHMLHGRYRIALSFPDLKMRTFSRIMSTPKDIERLMRQIVEEPIN